MAFLEDPRAKTLMNDLDPRFPEGTLVQFSHLPFLRAQLALNRHDPARAIEILQPAASYELGWQGPSTGGFSGSLFVIYVRAQAYLAAHRGTEAAAGFQKIIDHIGVVSNDPTIVAVARLQLARALLLVDGGKAKSAYEDFLKLWKDAAKTFRFSKRLRRSTTDFSHHWVTDRMGRFSFGTANAALDHSHPG